MINRIILIEKEDLNTNYHEFIINYQELCTDIVLM